VDKIKHETIIIIDPSKILGQKSCTKNVHFLSSNFEKCVFHKNLGVENTLLIDNTPYKSLFNEPYNVIFVETYDSSIGDNNNYLLGIIMP
jgi:hypothetical protein